MHVMEDVREACDAQPSSPGHAEQRPDANEIAGAKSAVTNNGYHNPSSNNDDATATEEVEIEDIKIEHKLPEEAAAENGANCESLIEKEVEEEGDSKTNTNSNSNDDNLSNDSAIADGDVAKRKADSEESPVKKLKTDVQENYLL